MQVRRHVRTECDRCGKGENSTASKQSKRKSVCQRFSFSMEDANCPCVCGRMQLCGRCTHSEKVSGEMQGMSQKKL